MHLRTNIRHYAVNLLKEKVDVGERVFASRPSIINPDEVPIILVYFAAEQAEIIVGDTYSPKEYQRNMRLNVDIMTTETVNPDVPLNENQETEDLLDTLAWQVERAFSDDWTFARLLQGYDPNARDNESLSLGMRLVSTDPYNVDVEGLDRIVGQRLQWEIPYNTPAYLDKKYSNFEHYRADVVRPGSDETTIDPVLISAEGEL